MAINVTPRFKLNYALCRLFSVAINQPTHLSFGCGRKLVHPEEFYMDATGLWG